jgi:hypothetical protein
MVLLRRVARTLTRVTTAAAQPDWLADSIAARVRNALATPRPRPGMIGWADTRVIARVRAHAVAAAGLVAVALAMPFLFAKIVLEGYPAPLVLLVFAFVGRPALRRKHCGGAAATAGPFGHRRPVIVPLAGAPDLRIDGVASSLA